MFPNLLGSCIISCVLPLHEYHLADFPDFEIACNQSKTNNCCCF